MFIFTQNSYVEALIHKVLILGGRAFEKELGLDEIVRMKFP